MNAKKPGLQKIKNAKYMAKKADKYRNASPKTHLKILTISMQ